VLSLTNKLIDAVKFQYDIIRETVLEKSKRRLMPLCFSSV